MKSKPKASLTDSTLSIFAPPTEDKKQEGGEGQSARAKTRSGADKAVTARSGAGTFWELLNGSDLRVVTEPWPPKAGVVALKAEVTSAEGELFSGTVAYRVTKAVRSSTSWQRMSRVREGGDGSVHFEAQVPLNKGANYIQFRVHGAGEKDYGKEFIDVTDWAVEVK